VQQGTIKSLKISSHVILLLPVLLQKNHAESRRFKADTNL